MPLKIVKLPLPHFIRSGKSPNHQIAKCILRIFTGVQSMLRININDHITSDTGIMPGKPTIRGTRIAVELLLKKLADGFEIQDIIDMYPNLERNDILAFLASPDGVSKV